MSAELEWGDVSPGRVAQIQLIVDALRHAHDAGQEDVTRRELEAPTGLRPNQITKPIVTLIERGWVYVRTVRPCRVSGEKNIEALALVRHLRRGTQTRIERWR